MRYLSATLTNPANMYGHIRLLNSAKAAAINTQDEIEARAKQLGVPVEEYKKQVFSTFEGLKSRAGYTADQVDAKAGEMNGRRM